MSRHDQGVPASPSGHQPSASATSADAPVSSQSSVPNAGPGQLERAYYQLLMEQGVWAAGHVIYTCGSTTGHSVEPLAFCASPEAARFLASGMSASGQDPLAGLEAKPASPAPEGGDAQ